MTNEVLDKPIYWRNGDQFTLTLEIHVGLGPTVPWVVLEGNALHIVRDRMREARRALHEGRPQ